MTHHYLTSTDATQQLHYIVWQPADAAPRGVLQLVHGMEEYIDRYDILARLLVARGWAVIGHDHLGHGLSGRQVSEGPRGLDTLNLRGHFSDRNDAADVVIADIHLIREEALRRWPRVPHFAMGHSMGSFFLRRYLALHPDVLDGAIICGTGWYNTLLAGSALAVTSLVGRLRGWRHKSTFVKTLTSPHALAFRSEGSGAWLSRDPENVRRFHDDPLCGFGFTCGAYRAMYHNLLRVARGDGYDRLRVNADFRGFPLLIVSGADDSVGGTKAVHRVAAQYRALGFPDVTEHIVPHDRHEVILEPDGPAVRAFIADWLDARVASH